MDSKHWFEEHDEQQRQATRIRTGGAGFPVPNRTFAEISRENLRAAFVRYCRNIGDDLRDFVWQAIEENIGLERFMSLSSAKQAQSLIEWLGCGQNVDISLFSKFFLDFRTYSFVSPGGIPELRAVTAFWQATKRQNIETSCIELLNEDGNLATDIDFVGLPLGFAMIGPKLFYRKAYARLRYELEKYRHAILTGTPGTGKSFFAVALMCDASMNKDHPPNIIYKFTPWEANLAMYFVFLEGKGCFCGTQGSYPQFTLQLTQLMHDPSTLLIVDGALIKEPYWSLPCKILQIISPQYENYHGLKYDDDDNVLTMPLWGDEEIELCRGQCYPHISINTVAARSSVVGNIPSAVFGELYTYMNFLRDFHACMCWDTMQFCFDISDRKDIYHKLVHIQAIDDPKQPGSSFRRSYLQFASDHVADRFISHLERYGSKRLRHLVQFGRDNDEFSAMRSKLLERMAQSNINGTESSPSSVV